jgi:hypothetical protein
MLDLPIVVNALMMAFFGERPEFFKPDQALQA